MSGVIEREVFKSIVEKGTKYEPAEYNIIYCARCKKGPLSLCYGLGTYNLCVDCREYVANKTEQEQKETVTKSYVSSNKKMTEKDLLYLQIATFGKAHYNDNDDKTFVYCDKCGADQLSSSVGWKAIDGTQYDLCKKCYNEIASGIKKTTANAESYLVDTKELDAKPKQGPVITTLMCADLFEAKPKPRPKPKMSRFPLEGTMMCASIFDTSQETESKPYKYDGTRMAASMFGKGRY